MKVYVPGAGGLLSTDVVMGTSIANINGAFANNVPTPGCPARVAVGGGATAPFYDYVDVVYDPLYGHWVSAKEETLDLGGRTTATAAENDLICLVSNTVSLWAAFAANLADYTTAGLSPQIRWSCDVADATGGGTAIFKGYTASAADAAAGPATATWTNQWTAATITATTLAVTYSTRSGWQNIATTVLTNAILYCKATMTQNGTHSCVSRAKADLRWIG